MRPHSPDLSAVLKQIDNLAKEVNIATQSPLPYIEWSDGIAELLYRLAKILLKHLRTIINEQRPNMSVRNLKMPWSPDQERMSEDFNSIKDPLVTFYAFAHSIQRSASVLDM